jgi:hypothetical protein
MDDNRSDFDESKSEFAYESFAENSSRNFPYARHARARQVCYQNHNRRQCRQGFHIVSDYTSALGYLAACSLS